MKQREVHRRVAYVEGGTPTRMRSNAVGGGTRTLCLAWEVAIMMPLHCLCLSTDPNPDLDPEPSINQQKSKKNVDYYHFLTSF